MEVTAMLPSAQFDKQTSDMTQCEEPSSAEQQATSGLVRLTDRYHIPRPMTNVSTL
jgi:hypothetical protein